MFLICNKEFNVRRKFKLGLLSAGKSLHQKLEQFYEYTFIKNMDILEKIKVPFCNLAIILRAKETNSQTNKAGLGEREHHCFQFIEQPTFRQ